MFWLITWLPYACLSSVLDLLKLTCQGGHILLRTDVEDVFDAARTVFAHVKEFEEITGDGLADLKTHTNRALACVRRKIKSHTAVYYRKK